MYERETERLQKMIEESESIVFFGGAGVSTESGIPDFRSADGIYHQKYRFSPEQVVSHTFFMRYPEAFYEFYKEKRVLGVKETELSNARDCICFQIVSPYQYHAGDILRNFLLSILLAIMSVAYISKAC